MEYVLTTQNLTKRYHNFTALGGLDMHVPKGSIYGFVGRNGAGKTTLIRLICGLQFPTSGDFTLYGRNSGSGIEKARRRIGAVVETPSLYLDMTAEDNLKLQYLTLGLPSYQGIKELLDQVGLGDTKKKKVKNFSLGMRQRLGIAVALCGSPDFLILDEPVNGLDPQGIIEIRELILKLNRENQITFLISSHILDELSRLATHYGFINSGRMVKEISAEELERECRKSARVQVSDTKKLAAVLDGMNLEYSVLDDTNALIDISSGDRDMRRLAADLNTQLEQLKKQKLIYLQGDRELKNAITGISHDLRTPLTAICGYLDLLEGEELNTRSKEYLSHISNRTETMKQLTEELFRYSVTVSEKELDLERVCINNALEEVIASFYANLCEKGITPEINITEKRVERITDKTALSRIFSNILSNVLKYSAGDLYISMTENGEIIFKNSAADIDKISVGRLFDRFYTVEDGTASTGLGLSIAKTLCKRLGGEITADKEKEMLVIRVKL